MTTVEPEGPHSRAPGAHGQVAYHRDVRPTLKDVAVAAGVHTGTASRALNPQTRSLVNAETARRVQRAAETLGYRPNPIARGLKTARSTTVGVVIPDLTNPIFPPLVRGVQHAMEAAGYTALVVNTDGDIDRERGQVESLRARQVDGLIVATARRDHALLADLHAQEVPLVLVNRRVDGLEVPSVVPDDALGVSLLVSHLARLGHTRIAHLAGPSDTSTGVGRNRAFHAALREQGLTDDPDLCVTCDEWNETAGARALAGLLDTGHRFTAVVAGNDLIALGCYDILSARGIRCPQDVSITGFNDMPFLDKLRPPLTTVHVPHFDIGDEAARMLFECLHEERRTPRSLVLPVTLVVRESTAAPPGL